MILIRSNFYELDFESLRNLNANVPQLIIHSFRKHDTPVFSGTNKMVQ